MVIQAGTCGAGRIIQKLLGLRAAVHPDGSDARVTLHTSEGRIELSLSFEQVAALETEIRQASILMLFRKTRPAAEISDPVGQLVANSLQPKRTFPTIDKLSGDHVFMHEFSDRLPIAVRLARESVDALWHHIREVRKRVSH